MRFMFITLLSLAACAFGSPISIPQRLDGMFPNIRLFGLDVQSHLIQLQHLAAGC